MELGLRKEEKEMIVQASQGGYLKWLIVVGIKERLLRDATYI